MHNNGGERAGELKQISFVADATRDYGNEEVRATRYLTREVSFRILEEITKKPTLKKRLSRADRLPRGDEDLLTPTREVSVRMPREIAEKMPRCRFASSAAVPST